MTDNTHIPVPHRNSSQKELGLIRKIYCLLKVRVFFHPPEFKWTMLPSTLFPLDTTHNAHNRVTKNKSQRDGKSKKGKSRLRNSRK